MGCCKSPVLVAFMIPFIYFTFSAFILTPKVLVAYGYVPACKSITIMHLTLQNSHQNCMLFHKDHFDKHIRRSKRTELVVLLVIFHIIFVMFLISMFRVSTTEPGYIPDTERWQGEIMYESDEADKNRFARILANVNYELSDEDKEMIKSLLVVERKKTNMRFRECRTCRLFKPDRSHHCSMCGRCVLRMDHHCPWVSNCIGWNNYKYFMLMIFYGLLDNLIILIVMFPNVIDTFRPVVQLGSFLMVDLPIFFAYCLCAFIFPNLLAMLVFHTYLILNAMTTIEFREKQMSPRREIFYHYSIALIKYNRGKWKNFCHIFGPPWQWWIPCRSSYGDYEHDGTYAHL